MTPLGLFKQWSPKVNWPLLMSTGFVRHSHREPEVSKGFSQEVGDFYQRTGSGDVAISN